MDWTLIVAAVFAAWVAVSLMGAERQRRLDELAAARAIEAAIPPPAADIPFLSAQGADSASPARRAA